MKQLTMLLLAAFGCAAFFVLLLTPGFLQAAKEKPPRLFTENCARCHIFGFTVLAPDLSTVGKKTREYIRESILDPNAVIVESYARDVMPAFFKTILKPEEVEALVDYLKTLKGRL